MSVVVLLAIATLVGGCGGPLPEDEDETETTYGRTEEPAETADPVTEASPSVRSPEEMAEDLPEVTEETEDIPASPATVPSEPLPPLLTEVLPQVKAQTDVPILLPSTVPLPEETLYTDVTADPQGYQIDVGYTPNCRGSTACALGMFAAKRTEGDYYEVDEPFEETVQLAEGIEGYYNPMRCGASCSPPVMEWTRDGVRYRLELKGATADPDRELEIFIDMANSAIAVGSR